MNVVSLHEFKNGKPITDSEFLEAFLGNPERFLDKLRLWIDTLNAPPYVGNIVWAGCKSAFIKMSEGKISVTDFRICCASAVMMASDDDFTKMGREMAKSLIED